MKPQAFDQGIVQLHTVQIFNHIGKHQDAGHLAAVRHIQRPAKGRLYSDLLGYIVERLDFFINIGSRLLDICLVRFHDVVDEQG
ncbi:hypothetical protein ACP26L_18640 [Paenibacillus sp. S-38]|uniref:hypothetical protein n=1 Tax=Paenibacillus sp. S-38 TaxID=3416710 RepID=UPI003CF7D329